MRKFLLSLSLILLWQQGLAQGRFLVDVTEYPIGNFSSTRVKCPGTVITRRHLLTTADCATPTNSSYLLGVRLHFGLGSTAEHPAQRAFIHPNYKGDILSNNIAVVQFEDEFNSNLLTPRRLGALPTHFFICSLFGFGGAPLLPETVVVGPYVPGHCFWNHTQAHCTEHGRQARACAALVGSPVACNHQSVDGILLRTGCLEDRLGRNLQAYHSVDEFRDWIESVSGAELVNQISTMLVLSALVIGLRNFV